MTPSLYLLTPVIDDAEAFRPRLAEACSAAEIAAVLLRLVPGDERTLVNRIKVLAPAAQQAGAALVVADPDGRADLATIVMRSGADGGHADDPARVADLCQRLKDGRNIGAGGLKTKHDAMVAGEAGVDYVLFGEPKPDGYVPPLEQIEDRATWWAEIFQTPCVVYARSLDDIAALAETGAEFVALGDLVWSHPDGPAAALAAATRILATLPERIA